MSAIASGIRAQPILVVACVAVAINADAERLREHEQVAGASRPRSTTHAIGVAPSPTTARP